MIGILVILDFVVLLMEIFLTLHLKLSPEKDILLHQRPDIYTLNSKINNLYLNEIEQQINNNILLSTNFNTNSSPINSLARKFSKIHIFGDLQYLNQETLPRVSY